MTLLRPLRLLLAAALAAVGLVALTPATAHACYCAAPSDRQAARQSDAVFTGTFARFVPSSDTGRIPASQLTTYRFDVVEVFAGDVGATADVSSLTGCGLERIEVDREYVVFATRQDGVLMSGLCSGTGPADAARVAAVESVTGAGRLMWSVPPGWLSILAF